MKDMDNSSPFVCNISVIKPEERERHHMLAYECMDAIQEMRYLHNRCAFRLLGEAPLVFDVAEFISRERFCCPFFDFDFDVVPKATWLRLTGPEGVKPFIIEEFNLHKWLTTATEVHV